MIVVGAVVLCLGGPTAAIAVSGSLAAFAGMARDRRLGLHGAIRTAEERARAALEESREFSETQIARAFDLWTNAHREIRIDPRSFARLARAGNADERLAATFLVGIECGDDEASRRVLQIVLTTVIQSCRTHDALQAAVTHQLMMTAANDSQIQIATLERIETKVDALAQRLSDEERVSIQRTTMNEMSMAIGLIATCNRQPKEIISLLNAWIGEGITIEEATSRLRGRDYGD